MKALHSRNIGFIRTQAEVPFPIYAVANYQRDVAAGLVQGIQKQLEDGGLWLSDENPGVPDRDLVWKLANLVARIPTSVLEWSSFMQEYFFRDMVSYIHIF